jgi:hypothetical protein
LRPSFGTPYTVKNNNQNLVYFHAIKRTRHNHTNFATEYKNSCWYVEFNIFSYEFLCKCVLYVFLYGNTLIFDYCFYSVLDIFNMFYMQIYDNSYEASWYYIWNLLEKTWKSSKKIKIEKTSFLSISDFCILTFHSKLKTFLSIKLRIVLNKIF